jgi:hypothetical protein
MTFTVDRGSDLGAASVDYATADGTAKAPGDYSATSGTLNFAPGEARKTVAVPIVDDALDEPIETFGLNLSNPSGGIIGHAGAAGTIRDDDPRP